MGGELTALAVPERGARFVRKFPMVGACQELKPDPFDVWIRQNLQLLAGLGSGYVAISATDGVKAFAADESLFGRLLADLGSNEIPRLLITHTDLYR